MVRLTGHNKLIRIRILLLDFLGHFCDAPRECCDLTSRQNGVRSHVRLRRGELAGEGIWFGVPGSWSVSEIEVGLSGVESFS